MWKTGRPDREAFPPFYSNPFHSKRLGFLNSFELSYRLFVTRRPIEKTGPPKHFISRYLAFVENSPDQCGKYVDSRVPKNSIKPLNP